MKKTIPSVVAPSDETEAAASHAAPADASADPPRPVVSALLDRGRIMLNPAVVRRLREARRLSQQDLADDFWRRNFRISIATIKRVETGHPVRFRIAREFARYFDVQF